MTQDLLRKDRILRAVATVGEHLLGADDWATRVSAALGELGAATRVDRVYVFEVSRAGGGLLASQRHEWTAEGVAPQIDNPDLQDVPFEEAGFGRWMRVLAEGRPIHGDVADFPAEEQELLTSQDITSIVVVPITVTGRWWGFMGFDVTGAAHAWTDAEVDALRAAAGVLGAAISRQRLVDELRDSRRRYVEAYRRERAATERLEELDELKTRFLDAVSHELRTPLSNVVGIAQTLEEHDPKLDAATRQHLARRLHANGTRLSGLLNDLLDLAHLHRDRMEVATVEVDLPSLIESVVAGVDVLATRRVAVSVPPATVVLDPTLTERILVHLLENVALHTEPETNVWVRADVGDGLTLVVEDDGPGIPTSLHEHVFEPFSHGEQWRSHAPGAGVGLALVARFAELQGGRSWLADRSGGGAAFHVWLPARPVPRPPVHAPLEWRVARGGPATPRDASSTA